MESITNRLSTIAKYWLPLAILVTILSGLAYSLVQQDLRLTANDPQIQMAEDAAVALANGKEPQGLAAVERVDMARSLAPFLITFDDQGQPVASSGELDGQTPVPPAGVFSYAKQNGQDRITWQPRPGVRIAAVVTYYNGVGSGFVLAGRSLREVEKREDAIERIAIVGWAVTILSTLAAVVILEGIYMWMRARSPQQ